MQVSIEDIIVKDRLRRDLGDLTLLMESMRKHGQLNPVVITEDNRLVAGHRRLESARRLGWTTVKTLRLDGIDEVAQIELELDENIHRTQLMPEEIREGYDRISKLLNPSLGRRVGMFFKRLWARIFGKRKQKTAGQ